MNWLLYIWLFVWNMAGTAVAGVPQDGTVWTARGVRYPVAPQDVSPAPPYVSAPEVRGSIELNTGRSAAFYLDGLDVARVRVLSGDGELRFHRVFGGSRATMVTGIRASMATPGVRDEEGNWIINEPPGGGAVWTVVATAPTRVIVEHPRILPARLAWEEARGEVLAAIRVDGRFPSLPAADGTSEVEALLAAQQAFARDLIALGGEEVADGVRAWQSYQAVRLLDHERPFSWPYWVTEDLTDQVRGEVGPAQRLIAAEGEVVGQTVWRSIGRDPTGGFAEITVPAGGVLRVQARALLPAQTIEELRPVTLRVFEGDTLVETLMLPSRPARITEDPDAAFPVRVPLSAANGELAGHAEEARLFATEGAVYRIVVNKPALVRVVRGKRRPSAAEAFAGRAQAERWAEQVVRAVDGLEGPVPSLLRALVGEPERVTDLPEPIATAAAVLTADPATASVHAPDWAETLRTSAETAAWAWWIRVELLDRLPPDADAAAVLARALPVPAAGLVPAATQRLHQTAMLRDRPSRALGVLELAWRSDPSEPTVRNAYQREFFDATTWSRQSPVVVANGDTVAPGPLTWLDTAAGAGSPIARSSTVFYRMPAGPPRWVEVAGSPVDPTAAAVLTVYVASRTFDGWVTVQVDDEQYRVLPLGDLERFDIAVRPGSHRVGVSGRSVDTGVSAWVSAPARVNGAQQRDPVATLRSYWRTEYQGAPAVFELPAPQVPSPVRVELRTLDPASRQRPQVGTLRSDLGESWPIEIAAGAADSALMPTDGGPPVSAVAAITVQPKAGTRQLWVEAPPDAGWVVSLSVRRADREATPSRGWADSPTMELAQLADLSRRLLADPEPEALLQRADALAQLGDLEMARQDLRRASRSPGHSVAESSFAEVRDRVETARSAEWLPARLALNELARPVPLSGGLVAWTDEAVAYPALAWALQARRDGPAAALADAANYLDLDRPADNPALAVLYARLLRATGREVEAAEVLTEAWLRHGRWQFGLDAAQWLVASEGLATGTGPASLGYGLASKLRETLRHPAVERLAWQAGRRSRWDLMRGVQDAAGRAVLTSGSALTEPPPHIAIREALITAPWPTSEGQIVTHSESALLSVDGLLSLEVDAWCQSMRLPTTGGDADCDAALYVDGVRVTGATWRAHTTATLSIPSLAGRHDIELVLNDPQRLSALSVRFRGPAGEVLAPRRDSAAFLASPTRPVRVLVAGPATLYFEVRGLGEATGAVIEAVGPARALDPQTISLGDTVDGGVTWAGGVTRVASKRLLLLPHEGIWQVSVRPDAGELLVRGAHRQEANAGRTSRSGPRWSDPDPEFEPFQWPAAPAAVSVPMAGNAPRIGHSGTWSFGVSAGAQETEAFGPWEAGAFDEVEIAMGWRMQAVPRVLWLHVEPSVRVGLGTPEVSGGRAGLLLRIPRPNLRLHARGEIYEQFVEGGFAVGSRGSFRLFRPTRTVGGSFFVPSVEATLRHVAFDAAPQTPVSPEIYNTYADDHPFALEPSLMYWAIPFQDMVAYANLAVVTAPRIDGLEEISFTLVGRSVLHPSRVPPVQVEVELRPTYRFANVDREEAYLQHTFGAEIGTYVRLNERSGLWVAVSDRVYLSPVAQQNLAAVEVRMDLHGGRGLRDRLPIEQDFMDLLATDRWGALDEEAP